MKSHEDDLMLANAYVDGELDASAMLAFERRMAKDKSLQAAFARVTALHHVMAAKLKTEQVSDSLHIKIGSMVAKPTRYYWRQIAASVVVAGMISSGATILGLSQFYRTSSIDAIVSGHERSLLAASPVDIVSSDHHTVKPWFDQRLALSPPVPELVAEGYSLQGGRVEIVNGKPVPTLVYKLHQHLISLIAVPNPGATDDHSTPTFATRDGYSVLSWMGRDFAYSAISDVSNIDLEDFQAKWRMRSMEN